MSEIEEEHPKRVRIPPENPELDRLVREWLKWAKFTHVGPVCSKCGKSTHLFHEADLEGFCVNCFNQRWPHSSSGPKPKFHKKKLKKQVVMEQSEAQKTAKEDTSRK